MYVVLQTLEEMPVYANPPPLHPCSSLIPIHTPSAGEAQRKKFLAQEQNTMSMQGLKTRSVDQESRVH